MCLLLIVRFLYSDGRQALRRNRRYSESIKERKMMTNEQRKIPGVGDLVKFTYKSGIYAGRVFENGTPRVVVETLAVLRHPQQGDLHNPYDPDVPMFHERRALAHHEKALVLNRDIEPFKGGEILDYNESRDCAVRSAIEELDRMERWALQARMQMEELAKDYSKR